MLWPVKSYSSSIGSPLFLSSPLLLPPMNNADFATTRRRADPDSTADPVSRMPALVQRDHHGILKGSKATGREIPIALTVSVHPTRVADQIRGFNSSTTVATTYNHTNTGILSITPNIDPGAWSLEPEAWGLGPGAWGCVLRRWHTSDIMSHWPTCGCVGRRAARLVKD